MATRGWLLFRDDNGFNGNNNLNNNGCFVGIAGSHRGSTSHHDD